MNKIWHDRAWDEYVHWQTEDKKTLKCINMILKDIDREPFGGLGKPEPLKGDKQGYWGRRIDEGTESSTRLKMTGLSLFSAVGITMIKDTAEKAAGSK